VRRANPSQPLVSVLTPSFNQGRWLADNLRSVACQSYPRIEQIVMDGGSTDETLDLLRDTPDSVRWRSEADRGQSHALNKAFAESGGEIIGWLNSDDAYFSVDAVSSVVEYFDRHPEVDVVYGHAALVNAHGLILQMVWVPSFSYPVLLLHNYIMQPTAFIRRSALGATIADETYDSFMDRELWLRLGLTHRFARLDQVLAVDRHYPTRKSIARPDLVQAEGARLAAAYGEPQGRWAGPRLAALKIAFRLAGVSLLPQAFGPLAFHGVRDSYWRLALRQTTTRRAMMPGVRDWKAEAERLPS